LHEETSAVQYQTQTERTKAKFKAVIRSLRDTEKKFNINDVLADLELAEIAEAKHKGNGNGSEPGRVRCWCDEGIINGQRLAVHRPCDCEYTARGTALVYEAEKIATQKVGDPTGNAATGYQWTAEYVKVMNRLAVQAGLLR